MKRGILLIVVMITAISAASAAPRVDSLLSRQVSAATFGFTPVVITFKHKPANADFAMLQSIGITGGRYLSELPMVLTSINKAQFDFLRSNSRIQSLYANHTFRLFDREGRQITGVESLIRDAEVTARNSGMPVSGKNIGVSYIDTGIDATHPDLQLGQNVIQNVYFATADLPLEPPAGFLPIVPVENQPITDVEGGHGTFGAGVTAGTGAASGGLYTGMAPGAKLIGIRAGNDVGLTTYAIVQAMDYTLVNQYRYNIRICNNSWGTTLAAYPYNAYDPINVATRKMHDRNITIVFAAGNDGDAPDMINPFSVAPWVISVAAAEKQGFGTPAGFSSRGNDNGTGHDVAGQPADPDLAPNLRPDITGSGVDIKSARSKGPGVTNIAGTLPVFVGANDLSTIPPAFLPFYTTSQGTSFSTPQVSGIIALMLEINPVLTPDEIVTILRQTANPMPYEERVVGAGYVDAHNAVRKSADMTAVPHPADLFPSDDPNAPQIVDAADDQLGTTAQDIREGKFQYDASANQIVYTMTVSDLSVRTPNMRWTMGSKFGDIEIFVTASNDETTTTYKYGRITVLATGTANQETIGNADAGSIDGNTITIRLSIDKINAAVAANVVGTTSTGVNAKTQLLIGSSISGGLLLNSDNATGSDFRVEENTGDPDPTPTPTPEPSPTPDESPSPTPTPDPNPTPDPTPSPSPTPQPEGNAAGGRFDERYSSTIAVGQSNVTIRFELRRSMLDAQINQNHGNQQLYFDLLDSGGNLVATADKHKIYLNGLPTGSYFYRVRGSVTKPVDFTIKSGQGR